MRTGDIEPSPEATRTALRQVISRCIYGVDINPMAVELCKVALWMESLDPGKPLSFLDHHIQCGNSLIGATPRLLAEGIPDAAFDPVEGDDKAVCSEYKKRNKKEREGQGTLFAHDMQPWEQLGNLSTAMMGIDSDDDGSIDAEHRKQERYERLVASSAYENGKLLADTWCAAFFWKKTREFDYPITEEVYRRTERNPHSMPHWMKSEVRRLAGENWFFHWHLAFPDVFRPGNGESGAGDSAGPNSQLPTHYSPSSGFDCVLGNPPWEMMQLDPQEFFATRDVTVANAPNMAAREKMIAALAVKNPELHAEYLSAKCENEHSQSFVHSSGRFPLTSFGRINLAPLFAELALHLIGSAGRAGLVLPTGVATDSFNQQFFSDLVASGRLASLCDFENREKLFPDVDSRMKFCTLTMSGSPCEAGDFAFFLTDPSQVHDRVRRFRLSASDIALLNPNTRTCPVFRTRQDAELTKDIYRRVPVLVNDVTGENPWGVRFMLMFMMNTASALFRTRGELEAEGFVLEGNWFVRGGEVWLPLYEAKMIWHFDHRFGTYEGVTDRSSTHIPTPTEAQHADPDYTVLPWYWISRAEVDERLRNWPRGWLIGFRDVARSTDERTAIFSLIPRTAVGHTTPVTLCEAEPSSAPGYLGNWNTLVLDFIARQKIGGTHLTFGYVRQFAVLPPTALAPTPHSRLTTHFLVPRVLELVYTAWDVRAFADDVWNEADDALRGAIVRQWEENRGVGSRESGVGSGELGMGSGNTTPHSPLPTPFVWNEDRRALIRAELDAYYAKLYGLNRKQLRYILDPHGLSARELEDILDPWEDPTCSGPHLLPAEPALDFPGETFRVLKEKEEKQFGEYRTRRLVLEAWHRLHAEGLMPEAYDQRKETA